MPSRQSPGALTSSGKLRADRAQQFTPFAALKGYYDLIAEKNRVLEPRRELSEEEVRRISEKLALLAKGSMIRVTHYDRDAYVTTEGAISCIDTIRRVLRVVRRDIPFADIVEIGGVEGAASGEVCDEPRDGDPAM